MGRVSKLLERLDRRIATEELKEIIARLPNELNEFGYDEWGFSPDTAVYALAVSRWMYENYFRVEVHGTGWLPEKRAVMVANHSGQLPLDGMMISTAAILEGNPPRLPRAMVERWMPTLPWVSTFFFRCGQVVGNRDDCQTLLEHDEAILVFPEGVRGSGKTIWQRYELQTFPSGFLRLALRTGAPIIPIGLVGGEESIISVYDWKAAARFFGVPYVPVPALLPVLGPLAMLPMPTKFILHFGEPLLLEGDPDAPDAELRPLVEQVEDAVRAQIQLGLDRRRGVFDVPAIDSLIPGGTP
jgi:1-acyl-sn-glycerol-3-phosphate acyltransferase